MDVQAEMAELTHETMTMIMIFHMDICMPLLLIRFSCLTLCDPVDCSLPGFSVPGIL